MKGVTRTADRADDAPTLTPPNLLARPDLIEHGGPLDLYFVQRFRHQSVATSLGGDTPGGPLLPVGWQ